MDYHNNDLLFERYHATRSIEDRNALIMANVALLGVMAAQFIRLNPDVTDTFDELKSDGTLGLIRAVELFDPSFGVTFATYACRAIGSKIAIGYHYRHGLRGIAHSSTTTNKPRKISLDAVKEAHGIELATVEAVKPVDETRQPDFIGKLFRYIPARDRDVVNRIYMEGMSICNIAKVVGVSPQRISKIKERAINKMRAVSKAMLAEGLMSFRKESEVQPC